MGPLWIEQSLRWRNFLRNISLNVISSADMTFFHFWLWEILSLCGGRGNSNTLAATHINSEYTTQHYTWWETGLSIIASPAYLALLPASDKQAPCAQFTLWWSIWFAAVWECYRWGSVRSHNPVSINTWHITCKMSHCVVGEGLSGQLVVPVDLQKRVLFYFHFSLWHCRIGVS